MVSQLCADLSGKEMNIDVSLSKILAELRFQKIGKRAFVYPAFATTVSHYVFFDLWGFQKSYLGAVYGFGNYEADCFADGCLRAYGGAAYNLIATDRKQNPTLRMDLGVLSDWPTRSSILVKDLPEDELRKIIIKTADTIIFPAFQKTQDLRSLLSYLISEENSCPWKLPNAAARAAQIAFLAAKCGLSPASAIEEVKCHNKEIAANIVRGLAIDKFLEAIVRDALIKNS